MLCHDKIPIKNKLTEQILTGLEFPPIVCGVNQSMINYKILDIFTYVWAAHVYSLRVSTPPLVNAFGMVSCKYI